MCANKYQTIVADPPWHYGAWGAATGSKADPTPMPYQTMSLCEIEKLPVSSIAAPNCELYLWTTQKYLHAAFHVIEAWNFKYCQALTWCKPPHGLGQGGVYCPTSEFLLLGRRGRMPKVRRVDTTWWVANREGHSKKPEIFLDIIESVSIGPRIELFARRKRAGWDVWGNEVESSIELGTQNTLESGLTSANTCSTQAGVPASARA